MFKHLHYHKGGMDMTDYSVVLVIGSFLILTYYIGYTIVNR